MRRWAAVFGLLASTTVAAAWEPPVDGYALLKELQRGTSFQTSSAGMDELANNTVAKGFVIGIAWVMAAEDICLPEQGITVENTLIVVRAYLEQNTDKLSAAASLLVQQALLKAFPCK